LDLLNRNRKKIEIVEDYSIEEVNESNISSSNSPEPKRRLELEFEHAQNEDHESSQDVPLLNLNKVGTAHFSPKEVSNIDIKDSLNCTSSEAEEAHYRQTFGIEDESYVKSDSKGPKS